MPAHRLGDRELWRLVGAVTELRRRFSSPDSTAVLGNAPDGFRRSPSGCRGRFFELADVSRVVQRVEAQPSPAARHHQRLQASRRLDLPDQHDFGRVETTPIVVDSVMYITEPGATVVALECGDWRRAMDLHPDARELRLCCGVVNRGVAVLDTTVFVATPDARLIAIDNRTGKKRWEVTVAESGKGYSYTSAPWWSAT
jgi:hypothetical protein